MAQVTPEKWEQVKEIFDAISEVTPAERATVLDKLDVETKTAVQRLLDGHDASRTSTGLLDGAPIPSSELLSAVIERPKVFEPAEVLLNRFEVQRELGSGGMGDSGR